MYNFKQFSFFYLISSAHFYRSPTSSICLLPQFHCQVTEAGATFAVATVPSDPSLPAQILASSFKKQEFRFKV